MIRLDYVNKKNTVKTPKKPGNPKRTAKSLLIPKYPQFKVVAK